MGKSPRRKLEQFFHDLDRWNRVVIPDSSRTQEGDSQGPERTGQDETADRRAFIIVTSDTCDVEPKQNAELA